MSGIKGIQAIQLLYHFLGKSPKTDTLSPKAIIPKNGKTGISFLGNRNPHFTGTPKNTSPKISSQKWFWGNSPCSGATPIILKRQSRISSNHFPQKPFRSKIHGKTLPLIQTVLTPDTSKSLYFQGFLSPSL